MIEGAAGAGKTTTLAAAAELVEMHGQRLVCVTPTLKAARVAAKELGAAAHSAAWLIHQHGFRWDEDGHRSRLSVHRNEMDAGARLLPRDILLVDEAGMLDQDTAAALLTIASESQVRVALVGDRHQLPAVGRGGVLDLAARWAAPDSVVTLDRVHRFSDPQYADLTLLMRTGERSGEVFDDLVGRGLIEVHASEVERSAQLAQLGGASHSGERNGERPGEGSQLVIADTREQVALLNAAIRDHRSAAPTGTDTVAVASGELIGVGDRVATRRNDRDLAVANRDTWTVTGVTPDGGLRLTGRPGERQLPPAYVDAHVELAYATTVYGAQGETVDTAHLAIGEGTGAAAAYVAMTQGRHRNTAHLVADNLDDARAQWITVFSRDRARPRTTPRCQAGGRRHRALRPAAHRHRSAPDRYAAGCASTASPGGQCPPSARAGCRGPVTLPRRTRHRLLKSCRRWGRSPDRSRPARPPGKSQVRQLRPLSDSHNRPICASTWCLSHSSPASAPTTERTRPCDPSTSPPTGTTTTCSPSSSSAP